MPLLNRGVTCPSVSDKVVGIVTMLSIRLKWSCLMFSTSEAKAGEHLNYRAGLHSTN